MGGRGEEGREGQARAHKTYEEIGRKEGKNAVSSKGEKAGRYGGKGCCLLSRRRAGHDQRQGQNAGGKTSAKWEVKAAIRGVGVEGRLKRHYRGVQSGRKRNRQAIAR